jgi:hypothetical protein
MIPCSNCGTLNDVDARFCIHCGVSLENQKKAPKAKKQKKTGGPDFEEMGKKAGTVFEEKAKIFQKNMEDVGSRFERKIDRSGRHFENWYDRHFKVFGPLISSFVGLIIFRFAIEVLRITGRVNPVVFDVAGVLYYYLLALFFAMLLSNYTGYFSRHIHNYRWISPVFNTIAITIFVWVVVKVLAVVEIDLSTSPSMRIYPQIEPFIPTFFVLILVLQYVVLALSLSREHDSPR